MPCFLRWPGVIEPVPINYLFSHEDMLPTLLAAVGIPDVKERLLKGMKVGKKTFRFTWTAITSPIGLRGRGQTRATSSSTGTTTGRWWGCVTATGRSCSRNSAAKASTSGRIRLHHCACPILSTSVPIRSSVPKRSP